MKQELKNKKLKNQNGITLIALVITIVILLILAGITINMLFGENGILARAKNADNTMKNAQQKDLEEIDRLSNWIDEKTNTSNGGSTGGDDTKLTVADYTWTQNKTTVTGTPKESGKATKTITKTVGEIYTYASGDSGYDDTDGWKVLGAKDGKLLIMTTKDIGSLTLSGGNGYNNGITQLNTMCQEKFGSNARSIDVEDINRVTEYSPEYQTIRLTSGNEWYCDGLNYGKAMGYSEMASQLGITGSADITGNADYSYYPTTLTESDGEQTGENGIAKNSLAYEMLFGIEEETSNSAGNSYWLASRCMWAGPISGFAVHCVDSVGRVSYCRLWSSSSGAHSGSYGVRAVVSL